MTIEDGTGVEDANTYVTRAEADAYFAEHPRAAAWAALGGSAKDAQLVYATRMLDASVTFKGSRILIGQALEWPRYGVEIDDQYWPENTIPKDVKAAVYELAISNSVNGLSDDPTGTEGIKSLSIGKGAVALEFDAATVRTMLGKLVPLLLSRFALSTGNSMLRRIVRA